MKSKLEVPGSLATRAADGRWRKLLVFVGHRFLARPGQDYRFGGGALWLHETVDLHADADPVLVVVDPLDGARWLCCDGKWERVGGIA